MARTLDKTVNDRQHLSGREFERLLEAVKGSRKEIRDRCLFLLMFRHGPQASEACGLVLEQVDTESRILHVARPKGGLSTNHPLRRDEIGAIKAWLVERTRMKGPGRSRSSSMNSASPCTARRPTWRYASTGKRLGLPVAVHPHMLRHACGFALVDQGADTRLIQDYLGTAIFSTLCATPLRIRRGLRS